MAMQINGFGTTYLYRTLETGTFTCTNPVCRGRKQGRTQEWRRRRQRKWITMLWIPVLPLSSEHQIYYECRACRQTYVTLPKPAAAPAPQIAVQPPQPGTPPPRVRGEVAPVTPAGAERPPAPQRPAPAPPRPRTPADATPARRCPSGHAVPDRAAFCPDCGAAITAKAQPTPGTPHSRRF